MFSNLMRNYRRLIEGIITEGVQKAAIKYESDGVVYYRLEGCAPGKFTKGCEDNGLCNYKFCDGWYVDIQTLKTAVDLGLKHRKLADDFWFCDQKTHKVLVRIDWYGPFFTTNYAHCVAETMVFSRDEGMHAVGYCRSYSEL